MKKLLTISLFVLASIVAKAQETPKWMVKNATKTSQEMKKVLSLTDDQAKKIYDIQLQILEKVTKYKKDNEVDKISKEKYREMTMPFVKKQQEIVGGQKEMQKWWKHLNNKKK